VPWNADLNAAALAFHQEHERIYGYATPERAVEVVTVRVRARQRLAKPALTPQPPEKGPATTRRIWIGGRWRIVPAPRRAQVSPRRARGPALILDYGSTTLVPAGWEYRTDGPGNGGAGNLIVNRPLS
jgi:N-methylhydantoinase A